MVDIPLYRPDLTQRDREAVEKQSHAEPFDDRALLKAWEQSWEKLWNRRALAFADPTGLIKALKRLHGWRSGSKVALSPLQDPQWREAFEANWLTPLFAIPPPDEAGLYLHHHPFGLPTPAPDTEAPVIEEISSVIRPYPGIGGGAVQVVLLEGTRLLHGGGAVVLSEDENLIRALAEIRETGPSALSCALGLSQMAQLDAHCARREEIAGRYLEMRLRGFFEAPANPDGGRAWEWFVLRGDLGELRDFLAEAGIGCGTPWFWEVPGEWDSLALPLYAALSDADVKKIINRVHRYCERRLKR